MDIDVYFLAVNGNLFKERALFDTGAQITLVPSYVPIYFEDTGEDTLIAFDNSPQYTARAGYAYASFDGNTLEKIRCARGGTRIILSPDDFVRKYYFVIDSGTVSAYQKQ